MKKVVALILVVLTLTLTMTFPAAAIKVPGNEVSPCYNNTNVANVSLYISSSGFATVSINCNGISGVTTKIVAETKLERKFGLLWLDVDSATWTDTVFGNVLRKSHTFQLNKNATYRAKTKFTVSGSGGANDVFTMTSTDYY